MRAADLREKSVEDLRELEKSLARDVFQNRLKNFTNRLDDTSAIRKSKRDLARVVTVLRERAVAVAKPAEAAPPPKAAPAPSPAPEAKAEAKPKKAAPKKAAAPAGGEAPAASKKTTAKKGTKSEAK